MDGKKRRSLDFSKLNLVNNHVSTSEALKDITPIQWSKSVLEGKEQANVKLAK